MIDETEGALVIMALTVLLKKSNSSARESLDDEVVEQLRNLRSRLLFDRFCAEHREEYEKMSFEEFASMYAKQHYLDLED